MDNKQIFFLSNKDQITIPYDKCNFERKNTKTELDLYLLKAYLRFNCTASGKICTTLNALTSGCGYSIKDNSKKSNERFRSLLLSLQSNNDIRCHRDINSIKHSEYFELQLTSNDFFYCNQNFVLLTMKEYETIINADTVASKNILLTTYLCIKKHIYYNNDTLLPKLAIPSNDAIKDVLGASSVKTVRSAISDLQTLNLIYCDDISYYYRDVKNDTYLQTRNVYAIDENELVHTKEALKDFYQVNYIYTFNEIDVSKIAYAKGKRKQ